MLLKDYAGMYSGLFLAIMPKSEVTKFLVDYEKTTDYILYDRSVLFFLFRYANRFDQFVTYDKMKKSFPNCNDSHICTMLKAAFALAYGKSPIELLIDSKLNIFKPV